MYGLPGGRLLSFAFLRSRRLLLGLLFGSHSRSLAPSCALGKRRRQGGDRLLQCFAKLISEDGVPALSASSQITSRVPSRRAAYRMLPCHGRHTGCLPVLPLALPCAKSDHRRRRNTRPIRAMYSDP